MYDVYYEELSIHYCLMYVYELILSFSYRLFYFETWEPVNQNRKRVLLPSSSKEYQNVLERFDATMKNEYSEIIKIERVQNERWYKQV